jgi:hypothetical protein
MIGNAGLRDWPGPTAAFFVVGEDTLFDDRFALVDEDLNISDTSGSLRTRR